MVQILAVSGLYQQAAVCLGFKESQGERSGNCYLKKTPARNFVELMGWVILTQNLSESNSHCSQVKPCSSTTSFHFSSYKILYSPVMVAQVVLIMTEFLYRCDV